MLLVEHSREDLTDSCKQSKPLMRPSLSMSPAMLRISGRSFVLQPTSLHQCSRHQLMQQAGEAAP